MNIIARIETHEVYLKFIFENLTNAGICVVILMAAQWISTNNSNTWPLYSQGVFISLFLTGTTLLLANGLHGFIRIYRAGLQKTWTVIVFFLYSTAYLSIFFSSLSAALS